MVSIAKLEDIMAEVPAKTAKATLVVVAILGLLASATTVANAQQQANTNRFYSGPTITSATYCADRSLGGPTTFPHDANSDGIADVCSLPTTRRATIAIQNAREFLAMEQANRGRFGQIYGFECTEVNESYGEPDKEPNDECAGPRAAEARGEGILAVDADRLFPQVATSQRPARFYSGTVVTSATFCANRSLGGPITYGHDTNGDGVADICSLPTTRRATIARQRALERFQQELIRRPASAGGSAYQQLLERECAALTGQTFAGDKKSDLDEDECARGSGTALPGSENNNNNNGGNSNTNNNNNNNNGRDSTDSTNTSISRSPSFPQTTRPAAYSKRAAQNVLLASGNNQIVVHWNPVTADDNTDDNDADPYDANDVFEYVVQYSTSSSMSNAKELALSVSSGTPGTSTPANACVASTRDGSDFQCTIAQLTDNTRYYVRVLANRGNARSTGAGSSTSRDYYTPTLSIIPGLSGPPIWGDADSEKDGNQPLNSPGFGQLTVAWAPPVEGRDTIFNYRLQWGTNSSLANNCDTSTSCDQESFNIDTTSHTIEGLDNNRTYYVRIQAYANSGPGMWTWTESLRLSERSLPNPGRPTNLVLSTVTGGTGLSVGWDAPAVKDNDPAATGYRLQWRSISSSQSWSAKDRQATLNAGVTTHTIPNLVPLNRYEVRVLAVNLYSAGPWSAPQNITLGVAGAPHSITLAPGARSISASWTTPTSVPAASGIQIQWDTNRSFASRCSSDSSCDEAALAPSATTHTIGGLRSNTIYYVRLRTTNPYGPSPWSQTASIEPGTPIAPTGVTVTEDADHIRQLDMEWTYTTETGKPAATGFRVQYRRVGTTSWTTRTLSLSQADYDAPGSDTTAAYTLTGLTSGVAYEVRVQARNNYGDGQWSEVTDTTTVTPGADFIPASITLQQGALTNSNVTIAASWGTPGSSLTVNNYTVQWRTCGISGGSCGGWGNSRTTDADETTGLSSAFRSSLQDGIYYQARVRANGASSVGGSSAYLESVQYKIDIDDNDTPRDRTDDSITLTELPS